MQRMKISVPVEIKPEVRERVPCCCSKLSVTEISKKKKKKMKLPCYPLVTIDPMMSIWSKSEKLYESDTILWCGIRKAMRGTVVIDGERYRFMGLSKEPEIGQKGV